MRAQNKPPRILAVLLFIISAVGPVTLGQKQTGKPQSTDDVVRTNTELVQTSVAVFDKQGRFVDELKKDDFELRVDGRLVPISFFENIVSGSQQNRLARVRGNEPAPVKVPASEVSPRQRTIVFFLDDRHLSLGSLGRTRKTLSDFVNKEMGQNDLVAIAVIGCPELTVRAAPSFVSNRGNRAVAVAKGSPVPEEDKKTAKQESKADADLRGALNDFHSDKPFRYNSL